MPRPSRIEQKLVEAGVIQTGYFRAHNGEEGYTKVEMDPVLAEDTPHPELQLAILEALATKLQKYEPKIVIPMPEGPNFLGRRLAVRHLGARAIMLEKDKESGNLRYAEQHERIVVCNTEGTIVLFDDVLRTGRQIEEAIDTFGLRKKKLVVGEIWDRREEMSKYINGIRVEAVVRRPIPMGRQ